jgi:hypothetical protein
VFTQIDKRFHAAGRLSFTILDEDYNKAASSMHSLTSLFHRKMALDIFSVLTYRDAKAFWLAHETRDISSFVRVLDNLRLRIYERHTDPRGHELLLDALNWAATNPAEILRSELTEKDSPNLLALDLLLDGIHRIAAGRSRFVKFRHDEQKQFGREMAGQFELAKNVQSFTEEGSFLFKLKRVEKFLCPIEMVPSNTSVGLQIIDVVLYLMSQFMMKSYHPREDDCGALCKYVFSNTLLKDFTYDGLKESFSEEYEDLMHRKITPEQLARAKLFRDVMEKRRIARMNPSEPTA